MTVKPSNCSVSDAVPAASPDVIVRYWSVVFSGDGTVAVISALFVCAYPEVIKSIPFLTTVLEIGSKNLS